MTDSTESGPLKRTIPPDLQRQVEDIQKKVPKTAGPPGDLDDRKKRWLVVGICLHTVISPVLRTYVVPVATKLCYSLTRSNNIHKQTYGSHLKRYPPTNTELNYEAINSNKTKHGRNKILYDYRVKSPVDLSRLFLQTHMTHFTAFDDSCDSSALLGIIVNICTFPTDVQCDAKQIRSNIRNPWAHCDFSEWSSTKYADSFQLMEQLVKHLRLNNREENKILGELNKWETNDNVDVLMNEQYDTVLDTLVQKGQNFLNGTTLGLEIVDEIRQQTHVLSEYIQTLCTEGENQFIRVQKELRASENDLQKMLARLQKLETESKKHEEKIENVSALTTSVSREIEDLKAVVKRQEEDHIPKNIQAQYNREIQEWKNDEATFLETRATKHILTSLLSNDVIIVTGSSGCGKSSNIHHAALYLHERFGYEIIPVLTGPSDIINYNNENKKQVFVEDDICGKESINLQTLFMWRDYSEQLEKFFKTVDNDAENERDGKISELSGSKLLISCRLHIYKEAQFQLLKLLTRKECNLLSPEWCLQQQERMNMMQKYLPGDIDFIDNVKHVTDDVDFFPLICKLSKGKSFDEVIKLLTAPVDSITKNLNHIVLNNKAQFCALVLCILFDDGFNTDWLMLKSAPDNKKCKVVNIVKEFEIDLSSEIARNTLKAGFSTLDETYFKRRGKEYRLIHDIIYKMAAIICGNHLTECFIRYAPTVFIRDHFIFESIIEASANDDLVILSIDKEEDYFKRLLMDLKESISVSTFYNKQLIYQSFRDKLISFFGRSDDAKQLLLEFDEVDREGCVVKSDKKDSCWFMNDTTPLMESASRGYFDIVCFLVETVKCDVNQINFEDKSPLYKACEGGKTDVVKLLLQNSANVYQTESDMYREFPLFVACSEGHIEIVRLLLQNDADVYQCNVNEESPLYVACRRGHTDIVKLLLQNIANVSQCNNAEKSPLYAACKRGHTDILKLLLQNNAEVSKCSIYGFSPLFVACKGGHTETVKLLLQNNAEVSQCNNYGMSPLFVACARGHTDTVKLLLQHSSDVALCHDIEGSLLHVACLGGHIDTVKLLLQYNTDVSFNFIETLSLYNACKEANLKSLNILITDLTMDSKCERRGDTALYVACAGGHTDSVKLLLESKADVSKGTSSGISPLHAACRRGYKDTVKLLMKYKADISQCNSNKESPLYVACEGGHTSTAKLLLQNKADVALCNYKGESPLFVACKEGHKDTVKLLLQSFADVSQCEYYGGNSPLHVVCDSSSSFPGIAKRRYKKKDPDCLEIVQLLIASKADVKMCNKKGNTPLDIARELNFYEIVHFLQKHL